MYVRNDERRPREQPEAGSENGRQRSSEEPASGGIALVCPRGKLSRFRQDAADAGRVCGDKTDRPLDSRASSSQRSRAAVLYLVKLEPLTES